MGIHVRDYRAMIRSGATDAHLKALLADHGMRHVEIEFLLNWFAEGELGEAARRDEELLYHMAETFGARVMLLGGDMRPENTTPPEALAERFAAVAARAAARGVTLGVEACAWTNSGTVDDALRLIDAAGVANAGAYVDVWHLYRRGYNYERLKAIGAQRIVGVQLGDARAQLQGTMPEDSLDHRQLPGEGDADVARFVQILDAIGYAGPLSVEILSIEQRARPPQEAARVSMTATRSVLEKARAT
jgi:sugar phosphate isomerase/epimerase